MLVQNEVGKRFKKIRKIHNLNQTQFANYLSGSIHKENKINRVTVLKIEDGSNYPSFKVLNLLIKHCNTRLNWLFTGEGGMYDLQRHYAVEELFDKIMGLEIERDTLKRDLGNIIKKLNLNNNEKSNE